MTARLFGAFLLAACGLAAVGLVPMADEMTHRVLVEVNRMEWVDAFLPFNNPPPLNVSGVRPLSVILLKLYLVGGEYPFVPGDAFRVLRATAVLLAYGCAAALWLNAAGLGKKAWIPAMFSMVLPPTLYSAWYIVEFDAVGAAALLGLLTLLGMRRRSRLQTFATVACGVVAFGLKESSALVAIGCLGGAWLAARGGRHRRPFAQAALFGTIPWLLLSIPLIQGGHGPLAALSWWDRLPVVETNLSQLLYLISFPGAALLLCAAVPRLSSVLFLALLALPPLVYTSHYEAVYFSPRWMADAGIVLLLAGVVAQAHRGRPVARLAAWMTGCTLVLATSVQLFVPSAREDLASRIFLALAPVLHGAAFEAAAELYARRDWHRVPAGALVVAWAVYAPLMALNYVLDWRPRQAVATAGRVFLGEESLGGAQIAYHDIELALSPFELAALHHDVPESLSIVQVTAWPRADGSRFRSGGEENAKNYLYWFTSRAERPAELSMLEGDLSWTRRGFGIFTPYWNSPAEKRGVGEAHNRLEEIRMTRYRAPPTELERLFLNNGEVRWAGERRYWQLPANVLEWPRRLVTRIPILEAYRYESRVVLMGSPPAAEVPAP